MRALGSLESLQPGGQRLALGGRERPGKVDDATRQLRDGIGSSSTVRGRGREREEEGRDRPREEAAGGADHFAGAGFAEKSTLGGSAICFSFSTVKAGFSL